MTDLFVIAGPAGSGKTTLGVALAERLGATYLDLDDATIDVVSAFRSAHPELSEAQALAQVREARYAELAGHVRRAVEELSPDAIVVTAPFTAEVGSPERWRAWIAQTGCPSTAAHLVWLALSAEDRRTRLASRGSSRDAELLAAAVAGRPLPPPPEPAVECLTLDALLPVGTGIDLVVQRFGNGPIEA